MSVMTPQQIVQELDKHIVGQAAAKRAVAIALRNRWRRMQLPKSLRQEISPKNILMIGPTGVGKTEIARRLAKLADAPFLKVEATKFTEVGYVGRDVESIIRDISDIAVKYTRQKEIAKVRNRAKKAALQRVLDTLLPPARGSFADDPSAAADAGDSDTRKMFLDKLKRGDLNDQEIEIDVASPSADLEILAPPGMEEMTSQLQSMFQNNAGDHKKTRKMTIKAALEQITEEESAKLINEEAIKTRAIDNVEQNGIVFIDEIDKVTTRGGSQGSAEVSREGVQRDLLPLIEGCSVSTKYGTVRSDHILFIASGAFQLSKPSDLIPELQGRMPIRVELKPLVVADFVRILTEPSASLTEQYTALIKTEGVSVTFAADGIQRIAEMAFHVNENTENIGARRLHTVMERLLENLSYDCTQMSDKHILIDAAYVNRYLQDLARDEDLSQYIL